MNNLCKLFVFLLSVGAVACTNTPDVRLLQADRMMDSIPAEALSLLKSIDNTTGFSKKEQALYNLLYTQALDKNALTIENDSMIRAALDYYKGKSNSIELAKCYFYLGCFCVDVSLKKQAIEAFAEAENIAKPFDDLALLGLIYGRMENEYRQQQDWVNAFRMNDLTIRCFRKSKGTKNESLSYLSRGQMYINTHATDSALYYLQKAIDGFHSIGDTANCASSMVDIATLHLRSREVKQAKKIALEARNLVKNSPDSQIELGLALIYEEEGQLDSARMIVLQQMNDPQVPAKYRLYFILSGIEQARGDYPAALRALKEYSNRRDSIYNHHTANSAFRYAQLYNRQRAESEKETLLSQRRFWIVLSIALIGMVAILFLLMLNHKNRRKHKNELYIAGLENRISQLQLLAQKTEYRGSEKVETFFQDYIETLKKLLEVNVCYSTNEKIRQIKTEEIWRKHLIANNLDTLKTLVNNLYQGFGTYLKETYSGQLTEKEMKVCLLTTCQIDIKGIATYLGASEKTVYNLRSKISKLLSANSSESLEAIIDKLQQHYISSLH